jgi:hypothetical protein
MIASNMEAMSQWYRYRLLSKPVQLPELAFNPWHKVVVGECRWISQHIGIGRLLRQTAMQSGS